jgi:hypothetical protein
LLYTEQDRKFLENRIFGGAFELSRNSNDL